MQHKSAWAATSGVECEAGALQALSPGQLIRQDDGRQLLIGRCPVAKSTCVPKCLMSAGTLWDYVTDQDELRMFRANKLPVILSSACLLAEPGDQRQSGAGCPRPTPARQTTTSSVFQNLGSSMAACRSPRQTCADAGGGASAVMQCMPPWCGRAAITRACQV